MESTGVLTDDRTIAGIGCYTGYKLVTPDEKDEILKRGENFGVVRNGHQAMRFVMSCRIDAQERVTQLTNIKMWQLDEGERLSGYVTELNRHLAASRPISELSL